MSNYSMEMILEYSQVFESNKDEGSDANNAAKKSQSMGGKYKVNAYFTSQEDLDRLKADGVKEVNLGHPRFKEGNSEYGIGIFMNLHRYHNDTKTFKDKKTKEVKELDFGGPPVVVDLTNGRENKRLWDVDVDGFLGNGTRALVKFSTYSDGVGLRLDAIGVLELVPYAGKDSDEDDWDI